MHEDDINFLVQKLLISNWDNMSYELFNKLIDRANEEMAKVLKAANIEITNSKIKMQ